MRSKILAVLGDVLRPGDTVTCALSGGADSVAMTHAVVSLKDQLGIRVQACHFHHHLRGEEANGDAEFCRDFCKALNIPLLTEHGDVSARMAVTGESLEEAARHLRYGFFAGLSGTVLTAHTADDNAETVLMNLIRGTGLKGLCGIPKQRDNLLRPMLSVSREEVLAYLDAHGLSHREDSTNQADDCLRNRVRHHVMPLLKAENATVLQGISRMTETLRNDENYLQELADRVVCSVSKLRLAPQPLRRRAIRSLLSPVSKLTAAHIEAAEGLIFSDNPSGCLNFPQGLTLRRSYDDLCWENQSAPGGFLPAELPCPGEVSIPELGMTLRCETSAPGSITVRPRKTGDRIRLPGGTKSVKKLMIDKKIPLVQREMIPILEYGKEILFVWGVAAAEDSGKFAVSQREYRGDLTHDS